MPLILIDPPDNQIGNLKIVSVLHDHVTVAVNAEIRDMQQTGPALSGINPGDEGFAILEERHPTGPVALRNIEMVAKDDENRQFG